MSITLGKPLGVSDRGRRKNNEDCIFPLSEEAAASDKLFLVCDGVGGADKGEVASNMACEVMHTFFRTFLKREPDASFVRKSIQYVETRFDDYAESHPDARGMATTMTMLYVGDESVWAAHIGDSRIYQFRNGKIVFRTEDHSLVNSWVKMGRITPDEARRHPQKNVILRAIQGSNHSAEPEVAELKDIKEGDCFMLCSDGVVESFSDDELEQIFTDNIIPDIKEKLMEKCLSDSKDNFSFYLIPVDSSQKKTSFSKNIHAFLYSFI